MPDPFASIVRYRPHPSRRLRDLPTTIANWFQGVHAGPTAAARAALLRCVVGNPFRPAVLDPAWFTPTVVAIAEGAYADRAFDRLPVLADALEDAGCDAPDLLAHLRGHDDVWVATGGEIADWWGARGVPNDPGHPADLFARLTATGRDAPPAAAPPAGPG